MKNYSLSETVYIICFGLYIGLSLTITQFVVTCIVTLLGIKYYCEINKIFKPYIWGSCYFFLMICNPKRIITTDYSLFIFLIITLFIVIISPFLEKQKSNGQKSYFWIENCITIPIIEFCFFGFSIYSSIEPEPKSILKHMFLFVLLYFWTKRFVECNIWIIENINKKKNIVLDEKEEIRDGKKVKKFYIRIFLIIVIIGGAYSVFYYPGVISPDTVALYEAAKNIGDPLTRTDVHSFAYTFFQYIIFGICDSFYFLTWIMILGFAAIWAAFLSYLYKNGLKNKYLYIITAIWISFPCNLYMLISTWKDAPFSIMIIFLIYMLTRYCVEGEELFEKKRNIIYTILPLVLISLFRSNGMAVIFTLSATSAIMLVLRKKMRFFCIIMISMLTVIIIKVPLYHILNVKPAPEKLTAQPFVDGIWENSYQGNYLPSDIIEFIEEDMMPINEFNAAYEERYTNLRGTEDIELSRAVNAYWWCLKNHPYTTILARMKRTYNLWSVFPNDSYYLNTGYIWKLDDYTWQNTKYDWKYISVFQPFRTIFEKLYDNSYFIGELAFIISRGGWSIVICMISLLYAYRNKKMKWILVLLPAMANTVALLFGCCYQDYRYMYPMFINTYLFIAGTGVLSLKVN